MALRSENYIYAEVSMILAANVRRAEPRSCVWVRRAVDIGQPRLTHKKPQLRLTKSPTYCYGGVLYATGPSQEGSGADRAR